MVQIQASKAWRAIHEQLIMPGYGYSIPNRKIAAVRCLLCIHHVLGIQACMQVRCYMPAHAL
jgi:hypothetical protein